MASLPRPGMWILSLVAVASVGCGSPKPEDVPQPIQDADRELIESGRPKPEPQRWHHEPPPMPEPFGRFSTPVLPDLEGYWLVPSEIPGRRELWIISASDAMLTIVDHHGRERRFGLAVLTPCSLRLTDQRGRARTRLFGLDGGDLYISVGGGLGLRSPEGAYLACVGTRNYRLQPDGSCVLHTEMLGVWEERAAKAEHCRLEAEQLHMDDETLSAHGELWLDAIAAEAKAQRVADRKAAETILAATPPPTVEGGSETAGDETAGAGRGTDTGTGTESESDGKPAP